MEFGRAAHLAQLLEYELISLFLIDSIVKGHAVVREDLKRFEGLWEKQTLGKLLNPLKKSELIPDDLKDFLENVRKKRNYLMHSFFTASDNDFSTEIGMERMIKDLKKTYESFKVAKTLFHDTSTDLLGQLGITQERLEQEFNVIYEGRN